MRQLLRLSSIFVLNIMYSCDNKSQIDSQIIDKKILRESLIESNIELLSQESKLIDEYVKRNGYDVVRTGTGLRYQIVNVGEGDYIKKGDNITLQYELRLLNGEIIYTSENNGLKTFTVGRGGVESGLEEAVMNLKKYSEAIIILPSHLAFGFVGDGNRISHREVLIYNIKVIDIK